MTAVVRAELRRAAWRPILRRLLLLTVLAIAAGGVGTFLSTKDVSEASLDQERAVVAARCAEGGVPPLLDPTKLDDFCQNVAAHEVEDTRFHLVDAKGILQGATAGAIILAWVFGASLIGSDWQSRALTTTLTWQPRRLRLLASKLIGLAVVVVAFTVALLVLLFLVLLPAAGLHGDAAGTDAVWWWSMGSLLIRSSVIAVLAGTVGFSVASIGRGTAAALGFGFAYIVAVENVLGGLLPDWRKWTLLGNSIVFVAGRDDAGEVLGRSYPAAGIILVGVAAVAFALAMGAFRRQEVP